MFKVAIHTYVATQIYFNLIDDSQKIFTNMHLNTFSISIQLFLFIYLWMIHYLGNTILKKVKIVIL